MRARRPLPLPPCLLPLAVVTMAGCAGLSAGRLEGDPRLDAQPLLDLRRSRVGGEAPRLPAEVRRARAGEIVRGAYRVCLDARSGRVVHVRPLRPIPGADDEIMAALRTGRWLVEAPPASTQATPALCFAEGVEFSVEGRSRIVAGLGEGELRRSRIGGATPHLPPVVQLRHRGEVVRGVYRVCVDGASGRLSELRPAPGIPGADEQVAFALHTWSWLIQVPTERLGRLCFHEELRFSVPEQVSEEAPGDALADAPGALIEVRTRPGEAPGRSFLFRRRLERGPLPPLPEPLRARYAGATLVGLYKLCADGRTGRVSAVRPLVAIPDADPALSAALSSWRYEVTWPDLLEEICFVEQLRIAVERRDLADPRLSTVSAL